MHGHLLGWLEAIAMRPCFISQVVHSYMCMYACSQGWTRQTRGCLPTYCKYATSLMQSHLCLYDSLKHWGKPKYLWALTTLYTFDVEYNFERHVRFGCWALCWAAICFRAKRNNDIHFGSPWSGASRTSTAGSTRARELSASGVAARQTQKFELDITSRLFSSSLVCGGFSHSVCLNLLC
jgi:hypothetical protein